MNPYEAHAQSLQQLQAEVGQSINGQRGGFVNFCNQEIPAIVAPFLVQHVFDSSTGGMRPVLRGDVIIQKNDVPKGVVFQVSEGAPGASISVTAPGSLARACQIIFVEDKFTFWQITVDSTNAGA